MTGLIRNSIRKKCWPVLAAFLVLLTASRLDAQLNVPLTIQEAIYQGAPTAGINRTQDPVTVGIPLADSAGISSISQLGLAGATVGQFRILGRWPSGNIKWVLVDTQADVVAGGENTSISLVNGNGNFGGPNLATDNGSSISVDTGAAQFVIRKANFNLFDQVTVNGKKLVASGTSPGLVVMGPNLSAGPATSCGTCNVPYASSNDPTSTAVIEENGPVRTVVKADGSHVDAAGHVYMHYTVRMHFYKGKTYAKVEVILRNADETNNTAGDFNSAYKGFASYEARVTPVLAGSRSFSIAGDGSTVSGVFSGGENAYLYQAYSNNLQSADWNAYNCTAAGDNRCVASYISRTPSPSGGYIYSQDGFQIVHGGSLLASGDHTKYPEGWADLSDATGAGIEIGVYQLSAYWPKSLQLVNGGTEARIGIWPDQSLFMSGGGQPYYQAWPAYSIHDLYFNFHSAAPASPSDTFLSFQHYLLARTSAAQYNKSGVFFYPILDPAAEDAYYKSIGVGCCLSDRTPSIFRHYDWPGGGAGNQHELRWSYVRNFLQRGLVGRYLFASHFYRMVAEMSFPHSDGFDWRSHPSNQLDGAGFPGNIASANGALGNRNWIDGQHSHFYGMTNYYFLTGDETVHDQLLDGVKDFFLNPNVSVNQGWMWDTRDIGGRLMGLARLYQLYSATGDPDAGATLSMANTVLGLQVFPELNVSGFGTGNPVPGGSQGISRARGLHYGCCGTDSVDGVSGRNVASFHDAILEEGLWEVGQAAGKSWPNYNLVNDLAYGESQWALRESYGTAPGQTPSAANSGFIYELFIDQPNAGQHFYQKPGAGETNWFHFYIDAAYSGDLSWRQHFEWILLDDYNAFGLSSFAEYGSHMLQAVVDKVIHPPSLQLVTVPVTVSNNGGGSYTLRWTVPPNAAGYRIKDYPGKAIVDWIGFNAGTNTFIGDPNTTWPWFACNEVPNPPAPAAAGTVQTFTVTGLDPSKTFNFALKAYISQGSSVPDIIPPTVSISAPASGAVVSKTINITAVASDNVGVANVAFQVDGSEVGAVATSPYLLSLNTTKYTNGPHTITAVATDTSGNTAQASVAVTFSNSGLPDTTPPTVTISSPKPGATLSGTVSFSANATDDVAVAGVQFLVDGRLIGSSTTAPYAVGLNTTQLSNGAHTLTAVASDLAGNTSQAAIVVSVSNSSSPPPGSSSLTITSPAAGSTVSGSVSIVVTAGQPVSSIQLQIDGANLGGPLNAQPYSATWDTTKVSNGPHTISATAFANSGTVKTSESVQVANNANTTGQMTFAAIDANTKFLIDWQDLWSPFGCNACWFRSSNDLMPGQTTEVVLRPGSVAPVADQVILRQGTLHGTISGLQGNQFTVQLDPQSLGPTTVTVLTGNTTEMLNLAGGSLQFGQPVAVRGLLFNSGNQGATLVAKRVALELAPPSNPAGGAVDTTPPIVSISAPVAGATVSGTVSITANATDDVAVASVTFMVDGSQINVPVTAPPYTVALNTTTLSNGTHTFTAVAADLAGNSAQASVTLTVNNSGGGTPDTTPPTVVITAPAAGSTVSGTITVTANATDNDAIASVNFQIDGTQFASVTKAPYAASLNTSQLTNGAHTISATASDLVGNKATAVVSVTVNNSGSGGSAAVRLSPSSLPFGSQVVGTTSPALAVSVSNQGGSALAISSISANGDFHQTNNCGSSLAAGNSCTINVTFTPSAAGTRSGTLTLVDNAGGSPQTVGLSGTGATSACPPNQWCQVLPNGAVTGPSDQGWNVLLFSHDTAKFFLYAATGALVTWDNAFWSYTVQGAPQASDPWTLVSSCGDSDATTSIRQQAFHLAGALGATDSSLSLTVPGGFLATPAFPSSGTLWVDDEAMNFTSCTSTGDNTTCQPGNLTTLTLGGLSRGVRQAAGYTAAVAHAQGVSANLACPAPTLHGAASTDHPPSRHPVAMTTYDSKRGRLWEGWGYQENWGLQDTWFLCVFQTSSCSAAQEAAGWQRLQLFTTGGENPGPNSPEYVENAMTYDPDHDVLVEFGGLKSGNSTSDMYVFCLSSASTAYIDGTATCANNVQKWVKVTFHDGDPGARDGVRLTYDTSTHHVLAYGGTLGALVWHSVASYDTASGDWCLSDTSQGGSNAASCTLPAVRGPTPPGIKFAAWTFDNRRGQAALYAGPSAIYLYDAAQNRWTLSSVAGGPALVSTASSSWAYDDVHDTYVFIGAGGGLPFQTWELPGSALGP